MHGSGFTLRSSNILVDDVPMRKPYLFRLNFPAMLDWWDLEGFISRIQKIVPFFVSYNYPRLIPLRIYEPSMKTIRIPLYPNDPSIILHNSQENVLKILSSDIPFLLGSRQRHGGWRRQRVQDRGCAC